MGVVMQENPKVKDFVGKKYSEIPDVVRLCGGFAVVVVVVVVECFWYCLLLLFIVVVFIVFQDFW